MDFKDRHEELPAIESLLDSKKFELLILYGRRRVGKTELVLHAIKRRKAIYYLATGENNLERFWREAAKSYPRIADLRPDYELIFEYLKDKADVVVIDEFQNLIKEDPNILHLFQSIVDTRLKDSKLKLILLGSSVSIITSKVLSYQSPLYGRRTASIKLRPVSFFDMPEFFPGASFEELVDIYGFAGGTPFYLVKIDGSFWRWLSSEVKEQKSFLRDEADFIMRYEFDNPSTYKVILEAIANGKTTVGEIKDHAKLQRTDVSPYLKNLLELEFIRREVPITENQNSRLGRYYLNDYFLRFWFKFIYPNLSGIESGIFDFVLVKSEYPTYLGVVFEDICRQYLVRKPPFAISSLGRWWFKDHEIDLVAFNESSKDILFAECKWSENVNAKKVLEELKAKTPLVQWNNETRKEHFAIFAKSFKRKENPSGNVKLYDLAEMEKIFKKK